MLRELCPRWLQEVLLVADQPLPMALATAHYTGGVLRLYLLEGVSDHFVALHFTTEVRRFRP